MPSFEHPEGDTVLRDTLPTYTPTVLPALPEGTPSKSARLLAKARKACRLLFTAGPFKLFKATHRKLLFGGIASVCAVSDAQRREEEQTTFLRPVTFSILVPLYNTPLPFLNDMIGSVRAQTYPHWELCLADGSDDAHSEVGKRSLALAAEDGRIRYRKLDKNDGISGNTNACIAMATGDYISLFDHDDILHPSALFETRKAIEEQQADFIYTDEATFVTHRFGTMLTYHYKPDFAPDNLRANNYICHFSSFSRELLDKAGLFRHEYDGSQDHDMILRLTAQAQRVVHVRKLLYFWRSHKASVASDINSKPYAIQAGQRAVHDSVVRTTGQACTVRSSRAFSAIYNVDYALTDRPRVSVLVADSGRGEALWRLVSSLSTYDNLEIVAACRDSVRDVPPHCRAVTVKSAASREAMLNAAAAKAQGDYLVLFGDDVEIITNDWIEQLMMYAQRADVGAVGAKLLHPNGTVHHAGFILGLGRERAVGAMQHGLPYADIGHRGQMCFARNVSAVSTSCLMLRRSLFHEIGGLDETLCSPYSDTDLCLKLRERGLLNVFTPHAELVVHTPCRKTKNDEQAARFCKRWQAAIDNGDPYFNPHFSLDQPAVWLK